MLSSLLRSTLACPKCHGELNLEKLSCEVCGEIYETRAGIPILLRPELLNTEIPTEDPILLRKRAEADHFAKVSSAYTQTLKKSWNRKEPYARKVEELTFKVLEKLPRGGTILDIGGGARSRIRSRELKEQAVFTDISWGWLEKIKENESFENLVASDCEELPFLNQSFDLVLVKGVLHHVPRQDQACKEIARILKPGGRALLIEPSKWSIALIYYGIKRSVFALGGRKGLENLLHYHGSPYESFVNLGLIQSVFDKELYNLKIEKSTPFRFPFIGGIARGSSYQKMLSKLERSFLTSWFGSYFFAEIERKRS